MVDMHLSARGVALSSSGGRVYRVLMPYLSSVIPGAAPEDRSSPRSPRKLQKRQLPPTARKQILANARELAKRYADLLNADAGLKRVAARLYRVGLERRRRSGRPCDPDITKAAILLALYRKKHPRETITQTWQRVYSAVLPEESDPRARPMAARNLRAAVRSRRNSRRRRRQKAK